MLEGGNPNVRHHLKGLERATFCQGVELSYCLVTVRALTETVTKFEIQPVQCLHAVDSLNVPNVKHESRSKRVKQFCQLFCIK